MATLGAFGALFNDGGEILLAHRRDHDFWNLPGGGVEKGETPWAAAVREFKEETGLEVEVTRLVGVYAKPETDTLVFMFICRYMEGNLTLNEEADQLEFFDAKNLPSNISPKQVERIRDACEVRRHEDAAIFLKTQRGPSAKELLAHGELRPVKGEPA